jgi:hypothetical protein
MKQSVKRIAKQWLLPVPNALRKRQIKPDPAGLAHIEHAIRTHYHQDWRSEAHYSPEKYQEDLQAHLISSRSAIRSSTRVKIFALNTKRC